MSKKILRLAAKKAFLYLCGFKSEKDFEFELARVQRRNQPR